MITSVISTLLYIRVLLLAPSIVSLAQDFEDVLAQTLKYPREARENKIEEVVYVSLDIDQIGELRSYEILQSPNPVLRKEVVRSFDLIQKSWKKQFLGDRRLNQKYLVILEFNLGADYSTVHTLFKKANEAISAKDNEQALKLIDQCIALNPYNEDYFLTRSSLYRQLGNVEANQTDILRARKIKNELLSHMVISGVTL